MAGYRHDQQSTGIVAQQFDAEQPWPDQLVDRIGGHEHHQAQTVGSARST
jgi:hypothetical protein